MMTETLVASDAAANPAVLRSMDTLPRGQVMRSANGQNFVSKLPEELDQHNTRHLAAQLSVKIVNEFRVIVFVP